MALSKSRPRSRRSTTTTRKKTVTKKKSAPGTTRSYTVLRKSSFDPTKKLSTQGKTLQTTKTGAHLASRVALARRKRPTRIYLYRHKKIIVYKIKYVTEDGKVKSASAKRVRTVPAKSKATPSSSSMLSTMVKGAARRKRKTKKTTKKKKKKTVGTKSEIIRLKKRLATLTRSKRR